MVLLALLIHTSACNSSPFKARYSLAVFSSANLYIWNERSSLFKVSLTSDEELSMCAIWERLFPRKPWKSLDEILAPWLCKAVSNS